NYANPKYYFRYNSRHFQELFQKSEVTLDDHARRDLYAQMQRLLVEDAPAVWLFMHPRLAVTKRGVQGIWKDLPLPARDLPEVGWALWPADENPPSASPRPALASRHGRAGVRRPARGGARRHARVRLRPRLRRHPGVAGRSRAGHGGTRGQSGRRGPA